MDFGNKNKSITPSDRATSRLHRGHMMTPISMCHQPSPGLPPAAVELLHKFDIFQFRTCYVAGPDPMCIIRDFDQVYMPERGVAVNMQLLVHQATLAALISSARPNKSHVHIVRYCHDDFRQQLPSGSSKDPQDYQKHS
jgi:hypothetical protein